MQFIYSPYIFPLLVAAVIALFVAIYAWMNRSVNGAKALSFLALAMFVWVTTYALEIAGADLDTKYLWGVAQYLGIPFAPYFWLLFALSYGNYTRIFTRRFILLTAIMPVITLLLAATTKWNGLIWTEYHVDRQGDFSALTVSHGIWFNVHLGYSYLLLLAGTVFLARTLLRSEGLYRRQVIAMLIAVFAPWVSNILYLSGNNPIPYLDPTPFAFTISLAAIAWAILGFRLVDIAPIARDQVLDAIHDGMIVFDTRGILVDINNSAARMIGMPVSTAIGKKADEVLHPWEHILKRIHEAQEANDELIVGTGQSSQRYEVRFSPLVDRQNRAVGQVLLLRAMDANPELQLRFANEAAAPRLGSQPKPFSQSATEPLESNDSLFHRLLDLVRVKVKTDLEIPPDVNPSWHQALERAFTLILRILATMGTLALLLLGPSMIRFPVVVSSYTAILALLWFLGIMRKINFNIRTILFLYLIYGLGLVEIVNFGFSVEAIVFFTAFVVIATLLHGRQGGLWTWAITMLTMGLLGWLIGLGAFIPLSSEGTVPVPVSVSAAVSHMIVIAAGTGAMSAAMIVLLENLNRAWHKEMQASNLLQQERDLLEQRVEERTRDLAAAHNEALKTSNELRRYYRAIEQSGSTIVISDIDGKIEYVNPQFERSTGYTLAEAKGRTSAFLKSGRQSAEYYKNLWQTISNGHVWNGEFLNKRKDGTYYWEYATIAPVLDPEGKVTNYVAIKEEITARKKAEDDLRKLSQAVEQSGNTVIVMNKDGLIEYVNPKFTEVTGFTPAEALGKSPAHVMLGTDDLPDFRTQDWWLTVVHGKIWQGEFHNRRKNGDRFWESATIAPVFNEDGAVINFVEIKQDITEEKLLQDSLRRSHEQQQIIDSLLRISLDDKTQVELLDAIIAEMLSVSWMSLTPKGGIFLADEDSSQLTLSVHRNLAPDLQVKCALVPYGKCLCGLAALQRQIQFSNCLDDRHEIRYEGIEEHGHYNVPILQGEHLLGVMVLYLPHGYERTDEDENFLRAAADAISGMLSRKRAETLLQESEARFRQIVENASDMIYRIDMQGRFTYANPSALNLMGYASEDEALGKYYLDLTTPQARGRLKRIYDHQAMSRTKNTYHEFPAITKDGNIVWVGQNVQLIMDGEKIIGFQAVGRDITALKQAQEALALSRDQALEASRFKSQLLSRVSHELRTPLGGILGYAELLQFKAFGELNEKQVDALGHVIESTHYLSSIVNDLLDEAQIESKSLTLHYESFSPSSLLERIRDSMAVLAHKKGLEFHAELSPDVPQKLQGDTNRLQQILTNLVGNAIKFTTTGSINVDITRPSASKWSMTVRDTGAGIPFEEQKNIFEPFRQVSNALTRENRGSGLGLAITKQLIELMDGQITLQSEPGKGSVFTVILPIIQASGE